MVKFREIPWKYLCHRNKTIPLIWAVRQYNRPELMSIIDHTTQNRLLITLDTKSRSTSQTNHRCLEIKEVPWNYSLLWRHSGHSSVSNHQPHGCLLNRLFNRRSKKTTKLRGTGLCVENSPGPVNSPHKGPVTRKMFPFDDVIMLGSTVELLMSPKLGNSKFHRNTWTWSN